MNDKVKNNAKKEVKNGEVITENESDITKNITDENAYNVEAFVAVDEAKEIVEDIDSHFKTLLVGHAPKLSSKSQGLIGYEVALNTDDKSRYLRLTSNDSGGLFSKEWVELDDLYELLEAMEADKPFKSSVFKSIMKGGSANNVSFLSAVLRSEEVALILKSEKSQFLHVVNPLLINQRDRLSKLKPLRTSSKA
ncbi:hypothetical protein [Colwellia sp. BRX8-9]|uniref:hypothetical protein n=1 Tax=Colwellia sp. BRX8-9 TaxID=2759831 RepID=UPI0015F5BD3B|nr:hypothetical protein [Colwellia sp. BRX8-9]MBA6348314.1 hypothetical protein [Colwellia sp. BRX8-9]